MQIIGLPDGTEAEFPDDMSEDEIVAVIQREYGAPKPQIGAGKAFVEGVASGGTLGFADELRAAGIAAAESVQGRGNFSDTYQQMRDVYRQEQEQAREQHPVAYGAGSLVGVAPIALAAPATLPAGMGIGAAYGAGEAENVQDIPMEALKGAAISGGVGLAARGAGKVIGDVAGKVGSRIEKAGEKIAMGGAEKALARIEEGVAPLSTRQTVVQTAGDILSETKQLLKQPIVQHLQQATGREALAAGLAGGLTGSGTAAAAAAAGVKVLGGVAEKRGPQLQVNIGSRIEDLGAFLKRVPNKYHNVLKDAFSRGGHALGSTIYLLQQQDPEFRKMTTGETEE